MIIDCFIPYINEATLCWAQQLNESDKVGSVTLLVTENNKPQQNTLSTLLVSCIESTQTIREIAYQGNGDYILYSPIPTPIEMGQHSIDRLAEIAEQTRAGLIYSDYYKESKGTLQTYPTIDYQIGSVRDDFNFGPLVLIKRSRLKNLLVRYNEEYTTAGWYRMRLALTEKDLPFHIDEFLYTEKEIEKNLSGERQFDYVDPRNRETQIEKEKACTEHLKSIGAFLEPNFKTVNFNESFKFEASVIIPVRNRVRTIEDAMKSVLSQETTFPFNLIVIDNHSTDGTSEVIENLAKSDSRVVHIIPQRNDLGIGGCWNEGVDHPLCGKFAIQLDSDDVYQSAQTLQKIVDAFYEQECAMVIGSYTITDFQMNTIPPGLIDHKEWTLENGRNNALRINGLGAPRAFYTPILRSIHLPNTSYGEDYALGLRISHEYRIGRIYESLYLCRRWEDNSDASLDIFKTNKNNHYKDKLRSLEIIHRIKEGKA